MSDNSPILPVPELVIKRLCDELGYSEHAATLVISELDNCRDEVKRAFNDWWREGRLDTLEVEGWNAQRICDRLGCSPAAGILNLDWLLSEPLAARIALERGFDRIIAANPKEEPRAPK